MPSLIFRKGLDLKAAVAGELAQDYRSALVDELKATDFTYRSGRLTLHLAREFGFCYGVDRAVDYAYQTRRKFPDRRVYLTGEIIHNPHVNEKLRASGIRFLDDPGEAADALGPDDVVILPAFGVTVGMLAQLDRQGCTLVDTTCGSVLNVWKNVRRYAEDGFTSVIHGKVHHEETRATASQALKSPSGPYLVVLDSGEAADVCGYIRDGGDREAFLARFADAASPGFDPDRDLVRVGLANQTTMLMSESLEVGEMFRAALAERYGADAHWRTTTARSTRSAAPPRTGRTPSSRLLATTPSTSWWWSAATTAAIRSIWPGSARTGCPTYHIADDDCLVSADEIRHRPVGAKAEVTTRGWLPAGGPVLRGPDRRRLDAGQPGRRRDPQDRRLRRRLGGDPVNTPRRPVVVPRRSGGVRPPCLSGAA